MPIRTSLSKSNIVLLNILNGEAAPMTYCLPLCSAIMWPCPNPNPSSGSTTHWMAGSLFSYMTWCKSSATWLQQDVDRTTERDEQLLGLIAPGAKCRPMDIFGVVQSRLLKVPLRRRHLVGLAENYQPGVG